MKTFKKILAYFILAIVGIWFFALHTALFLNLVIIFLVIFALNTIFKK